MRTEDRAVVRAGDPLPTPALVVDLDAFDDNVAAMTKLLSGTGKTVRPHVKTHRTPELARRQIGGSAVGVTCATVGEAEAMVGVGICDVLLANEIVDPTKIARVVALGREAAVSVIVDDPMPVHELSRAAVAAGVTIGVLVDIDILLHRCGVGSTDAAIELARAVVDAQGIRFAGIMGYEGRIRGSSEDRSRRVKRAYRRLAETKSALLDAGLPVDVVSAAGTSTLREALADPTITEIQAGVYALLEPQLVALGLPFRCATTIQGQVISRHHDHVVLDVGRRTVGMEYGPPVPVDFDAQGISVGDEHSTIAMREPLPALGSLLSLVPAQIRTTFNLHDHVWVSRAAQVIDRWPIAARGASN